MNQEKIGKFIAELRRQKGLTQVELAEKLGVTDRSISKWENGKCMPDLSLFKPLCEELEITINELLSGEKIKQEMYQEKLEENIVNTIDYTNKKIIKKNNLIGIILLMFGFLITLSAITIFPSESSWNSLYSIFGIIIALIGFSKFTKNLNYFKRLLLNIGFFIIFLIILFCLDYLSVIYNKEAPRFSFLIETGDNMIIYRTPFYNVFRINRNTKNEYYIIDTKKNYTEDNIPISPFNRDKSGIDNIIKYQNKYVGNNSNDAALISSLPLSEYGYVFEIDLDNLELIINYNVTDWYINENSYLEKSLLYNSISIFSLIENVNYITYNFSGNNYKVERNTLEELYPNYKDIIDNNKINKDNFNKYVEEKMNDVDFVLKNFDNIFNKKIEIND